MLEAIISAATSLLDLNVILGEVAQASIIVKKYVINNIHNKND